MLVNVVETLPASWDGVTVVLNFLSTNLSVLCWSTFLPSFLGSWEGAETLGFQFLTVVKFLSP